MQRSTEWSLKLLNYIISCLHRTDDINSFLNYKFVLSTAGCGCQIPNTFHGFQEDQISNWYKNIHFIILKSGQVYYNLTQLCAGPFFWASTILQLVLFLVVCLCLLFLILNFFKKCLGKAPLMSWVNLL